MSDVDFVLVFMCLNVFVWVCVCVLIGACALAVYLCLCRCLCVFVRKKENIWKKQRYRESVLHRMYQIRMTIMFIDGEVFIALRCQ